MSQRDKFGRTINRSLEMVERLEKLFANNGVFEKAVVEEGGDISWFSDVRENLKSLFSNIEELHMAAVSHLDMEEESVENTSEGEGGMFMGAVGTPYPEEDNPVKDAIIHRLSVKYGMEDLLKKYGLDRVEAAIDDVAGFHSDAEELGSSDISIMVNQVMDNLGAKNEELDYLKKLAGV